MVLKVGGVAFNRLLSHTLILKIQGKQMRQKWSK